MRKVLAIAVFSLIARFSIAQQDQNRFNIMAGYSVGLQFFKMTRMENINTTNVNNENMGVAPGGYIQNPQFSPSPSACRFLITKLTCWK